MNPAADEQEALPQGWKWTTLAHVADLRAGFAFPIPFQGKTSGDYPFAKVGDISAGARRGEVVLSRAAHYIDATDAREIHARPLPARSIVFAKIGEAIRQNFRAITSCEMLVDNNVMGAVPNVRLVEVYYLYYYLNTVDLYQLARATAVPSVRKSDLQLVAIPLPPLPVQRAIVARLEELFTLLDAGRAGLERSLALLRRYRQSVLKAAVEGRLSADWRATHGPPAEDGTALLERLRREQRAGKAAKAAPPLDADSLPELPEGWAWARVEELGTVQLGRQRSPAHHQGPHMRPYLRVANVYEGRLDLSDVKQMNFTPMEYERFALHDGDILLNEGQSLELVGRAAIYSNQVPDACFQNTLLRFRTGPCITNRFALAVFHNYLHTGRFQKVARWTTSIAHLGAARFACMEIPLPPLAEQAFIVSEVEHRLSVMDELTRVLTAELTRARRLRQSLLRAAFTGKLARRALEEPNMVGPVQGGAAS